MGLILVLVTFPSEDSAAKIIDQVIDRKLAGCILTTDIKSAYIWNEEKHNDDEIMSLFKTTQSNLENLERYILENHPYEVPSIIKLNASANTSYENWIANILS